MSHIVIQGIELPDPDTLDYMFRPIMPRVVVGDVGEAIEADYEVVEFSGEIETVEVPVVGQHVFQFNSPKKLEFS